MSVEELFADAHPNPQSELKMPLLALTENSALNLVLAVQARVSSGHDRRFVIDCKRAVKVTDGYMETLISGICRGEGVTVVFANAFALIRELGDKYARMYEVGWLVEYA